MPSATLHFEAAAIFGGIAAGAAIGGDAIRQSRGASEAPAESSRFGGARYESESASSTQGGRGGGGPVIINVTTGGALLATAADLNKAIRAGVEYAERLR